MYQKLALIIITIIFTASSLSKSHAFNFPLAKYKHIHQYVKHYRHSDLNQAQWNNIQQQTEWPRRAGLQVLNHRGKFYLLGGRQPLLEQRFPNESILFGDVWMSDDKGSSWQHILNTDDQSHWPARAYFKAVSKGKYMYVIGGQNFKPACVIEGIPDNSPACPQVIPKSEFFNDVWRSKDGIQWKKMTVNAPWQGRAGLMVEVLRGRLYVFGGSKNDDSAIVDGAPQREYFNDVWSSSNGKHWRKESDAPWPKRAGGATLTRNGYIYMLGGEFGFLPDEMGKLPYLNDVWKTRNGRKWIKVTDAAQWSARPGHQCGVMYQKIVCFGGFGLPFNPTKVWVSESGKNWKSLSTGAWGAMFSEFNPVLGSEQIKYDFDIVEYKDYRTGKQSIFTFGGDREVFFLPPPLEGVISLEQYNFDRVDNDVWQFGFEE